MKTSSAIRLPQQNLSIEQFEKQIEQEFCHGSGISKTLYQSAVEIRADLEFDHAGEPITPIHDALNWGFTRFGHQVKESLYAAFLMQHTGDPWQLKLSKPRQDKDKPGKLHKYETPIGNGSKLFLPSIPPEIRRKIGARYGVEVPLISSFWQWLKDNPSIPIHWTEGGKKSLSLLSEGYVAIALIGVNGGYRNVAGDRLLNPEIEPFCTTDRQHILVFDQDEKLKTQHRVNVAIFRFGSLLSQTGGSVAIASWDSWLGKGVDDFKVSQTVEALDQVLADTMPLTHWQHWQRLKSRLTWQPNISLKTADLSSLQLPALPLSGIIGIASAKGTGKTKFMSNLVNTEVGAIALSHRIALARNICTRLGLDYRGDITSANSVGAVENGLYRIGVGSCIDGLLAINPEKFIGRDLFLDEVVQIVRHLLSSSTCGQHGKRQALLSRFESLIRGARRVICADADLDNATLHYLRELRGESSAVFLIRNDYQSEGYPVRFIESGDRSAITAELLARVAALPHGKVLFITTDNKGVSEEIATLIQREYPSKRVLVINSKSSGGQFEREFINDPDSVLSRGDYDVVIASPSMSTGVSIESQGIVDRVVGIFTGASSTDADMAQALGRVRQPVERIVWCARTGRNFSKVSRSANPIEVKDHLKSLTSGIVGLARPNLRTDIANSAMGIDWQSEPHINMFCKIVGDQNRAMYDLRTALLVRLKHEGNQVCVESKKSNPAIKLLLHETRHQSKVLDAQSKATAEDYTALEVLALENKEGLSLEQQQAIAKFWLKEFYCLDKITVEDVLADNDGRRRAELRSLEELLYPDVAADRTVKNLEEQASWNKGICPWDLSQAELRCKLRERIGLKDFLNPEKQWLKADIKPYADRARELSKQIKVALHFTITAGMSDVQVIHQLLSQMGIKVCAKWQGTRGSESNPKHRVYRLDSSYWREAIAILQRRAERRQHQDVEKGSPVLLIDIKDTGDPKAVPPETLEEKQKNFYSFNIGALVSWHRRASEFVVVGIEGDHAILQLVNADQIGNWLKQSAPIGELRLAVGVAA
jgi:Domain of unknown function (DUF3854)/Origin of replication binding protein